MTKMLVDGGVAVNIMPYTTYRKLGLGEDDLIQTDVMLKDFEGVVSPARGTICVDLTIESKTLHQRQGILKYTPRKGLDSC